MIEFKGLNGIDEGFTLTGESAYVAQLILIDHALSILRAGECFGILPNTNMHSLIFELVQANRDSLVKELKKNENLG